MIEPLQISASGFKLTKKIDSHVRDKIGSLEKYIPKNARESTHGDVKLKKHAKKNVQVVSCEVILHLPKSTLTVKETEPTAMAAIDTAESKLKVQLKKYKDTHSVRGLHKRVIRTFKRNI